MSKTKIKIFGWNNEKLDTGIVTNEKDAIDLFKRWKKKGFF
jgi:hypothetical protein